LRFKAAKKLGLESVPVVLADELTPSQIKAFRLLANQSSNWAAWDEDLLKLELEGLAELEFDLTLTGFDEGEVERLLNSHEEEAPTQTRDEEDETAPPINEGPAITKLGDIWLLGPHRLLCGDSVNGEAVKTLMEGTLAEITVTDPPYNINYGTSCKDRLRHKAGKRAGRKILNDNLGDAFGDFLMSVCSVILSVTKGAVYLCMSSSELHTLYSAFLKAGGHWSTFIIWAKSHFTIGQSDYQRQYEVILYGWKEGEKHYWCGDRGQSDVWFIDKPAANPLHPTQKPIALMERAISNSSKEKDVVFDPFGGSGSTLIACEKLNRSCYTIELDPRYCDVIVKRWQDFSGDVAILEQTGQSFNDKTTS
jgi:DNA modification methylase